MRFRLHPIYLMTGFILLITGIPESFGAEKALRFTTSLAEAEWKVMREVVWPMFDKQTGVRVEASPVEAADLGKMLMAMVRARRMEIDIFAQDNMRIAELVDMGVVEDLSAYRSMIPPEVPKALVEGGVIDKKLYFLPYRPNVQITYVNSKKLKLFGLKPPKDWYELFHVAKTFYEKEGIGRLLFKATGGAPTTTQLYEWIIAAGGDPFAFKDVGSMITFTFLQRLWPYVHPDSKKAKWDTSNEYLARESVYLAQNWPFGVPLIVQDWGKKWLETYNGWAGPYREAHVIGGEVLGIPKGSPNREMALKFVRFLQSREIQKALVARLGWPPIRDDAMTDVEEWMKPHFKSVMDAMKHGVFRANVPYWAEFDSLLNEAFSRIVLRGEDVVSVLNNSHDRMERAKKRYK